MSNTPVIQKHLLKGHRKPVLCLAHSSERRHPGHRRPSNTHTTDNNALSKSTTDTSNKSIKIERFQYDNYNPCLLLSGSEDGTARLWDLRTSKTAFCMVVPSAASVTAAANGRATEQITTNDDREVTSVAFYPFCATETAAANSSSAVNDSIDQLLVKGLTDCTVYISTANKVYGYDLRYHATAALTYSNNSSPCSKNIVNPILKQPHFDLSPRFQSTDEINELSFSYHKRSNKEDQFQKIYLSAADDSGEVHVIETYSLQQRYQQCQQQNQSCHSIRQTTADTTAAIFSNDHCDDNNDCSISKSLLQSSSSLSSQPIVLHHADPESYAIVSCASFRPNNAKKNSGSWSNGSDVPHLIASGGTDCKIHLWDISRPRKPVSTIQIQSEGNNTNTATTQLCNPPFIHSLSWSPSGRLLSAGVGDGSCAILRGEGRHLVQLKRLGWDNDTTVGHTSAVGIVKFASFGLGDVVSGGAASSAKIHITSEDRLMISAGNDGNILFWDLGADIAGSNAADPSLYFKACLPLSASTTNHNHDTVDNIDQDERKDEEKEEDTTSNTPEHSSISTKKGKKKGKGGKKGRGKNSNTKKSGNITNEGLSTFSLSSSSPPKVLFRIDHRCKTNWLACSRASDPVFPSSLFVADTSCDISAYVLPL